MADPTQTRFTVLEELGAGAIGVVHRVRDHELGRDLARKTLLNVTPDEVYRLKQEFRAVAGLVHPNLVRLHELFAEGGACFFTMDLVDGLHLDEYVRGTATVAVASGVRASARARRPDESLPASFDRERFFACMRQVVAGVAALHAAGQVHRDLKPSNVLVDADGLAVILDFGFAVPWRAEERLAGQDDDVAGTLPYMAPEQLSSGRVGPPADMYSLGAMMFELLTGRVPFSGRAEQVFVAKGRPIDPATLDGVEPELRALLVALLAPEAAQRPTAVEVLVRLGGAPSRTHAGSARGPFRGRDAELGRLVAVYTDVVATGRSAVVRLQGASGIGKSELLRRFLAGLVGAPMLALGRSAPQESVPYKVFDGVMDEVSQRLVLLPEQDLRALWPEPSAPLLRLFPVLQRVDPTTSSQEAVAAWDLREERRLAFEGVRQLLARLAARGPLVLAFDDVQWGDADSLALLASLLSPMIDAPVLFVLAYRAEELTTSPFLRGLALLHGAAEATTVALGALSEADTAALCAELLRAYGSEKRVDAATLLRESAGSPFFIGEVARNLAESGGEHGLDSAVDVVAARYERLNDGERALLETVVAAGRAVDAATALAATGRAAVTRLELHRLSDLRWLRRIERDADTAFEVYHDRLRERVLERLGAAPDRLRDTHRRLASTLDRPDADPELLLFHHDAAGNHEAAGRWAIAAADRANNSLAFARAAELYLRAAELAADSASRANLHTRRAEALVNAGRALDAARSFEAAAGLLADPRDAIRVNDLRRRAGEHYLRTAHYDEGLALMDGVLRAVGASLPRSQRAAMLPAITQRLRFLARGTSFALREPEHIPEAIHRRLETLWSAAISLALLDHQRADPVALTHLIESLERGSTAQALRALAYEASVLAGVGGGYLSRKSAAIQAQVHGLAEARGIPYERAWARLGVGSAAWFGGEWKKCVAVCDEGAAIFREHCRGVSWEIATMEMFGLSALGIIGDIDELGRRVPAAIKAAEERGDLFALNNSRLGEPSVLWLARGQVSELRQLAAKADRSMWKGGYHAHRYHHAFAVGQADLYDDDPWSCLSRLAEHWPGLKEARILYLRWPQIELRHLRARASLLAARHLRDGRAPPREHRRARYRELLRFVAGEARAIARGGIAPAPVLAAVLRASLAQMEGDPQHPALRRAALHAARGADMTLLADLLAAPASASPELRRALGVDTGGAGLNACA